MHLERLSANDFTQCLDLAKQGDSRALDAVARRACTISLRTASVATGGGGIAHEIAQDAAIDVIRGLSGLKDSAAFDAWVHAIAVRRTRRALRMRSLLWQRETSLEAVGDQGHHHDRSGDIATRSALSSAIRRLPVNQRIALALRYVHDLSDEDIAKAMSCKIGTVHSHLSRARKSLRDSPALSEINTERGGSSELTSGRRPQAPLGCRSTP